MPTYAVSLDKQYEQIAMAAASEVRLTVGEYIDKVVKEHLNRIGMNQKVS